MTVLFQDGFGTGSQGIGLVMGQNIINVKGQSTRSQFQIDSLEWLGW